MNSTERAQPTVEAPSQEVEPADRAELLARFRGPVDAYDQERVEFWRGRSDAEHARAMIELADFAEKIVTYTGYRKNPDDIFPGFPTMRDKAAREAAGGRA